MRLSNKYIIVFGIVLALVVVWEFLYFKKIQAEFNKIDDADLILKEIISNNNLSALETRKVYIDKKFILGRTLFHEPLLSGTRDVACVTCHLPEFASTDGLSASIGSGGRGLGTVRKLAEGKVNQQPRNSLDLFNRDHNLVLSLFWDGNVEVSRSSEENLNGPIFHTPLGSHLPNEIENLMAAQSIFPITRHDEMLGNVGSVSPNYLPTEHANKVNELANLTSTLPYNEKLIKIMELIINRLVGDDGITDDWHQKYRDLFTEAYPGLEIANITPAHVMNALSRYEEIAFATRNTPWDNYLKGNNSAISLDAKLGAKLFYGKGRCSICHSGELFSDFNFHSIGVPKYGHGFDGKGEDLGRYYVTKDNKDKFKFRTPPLRNVMLTSPYFHNGSVANIKDVIEQHINPYLYSKKYNDDGSFVLTNEELQNISPISEVKLILTKQEINYLIEFLLSLTDNSSLSKEVLTPNTVPSGLLKYLDI